jgi:large subunit ribosomal protein L11
MPDLNAYNLEEGVRIVAGTARNMGIAVKGLNDSELADQAKEAAVSAANAAKLEADLEAIEASAKALAEGASVEVEATAQGKDTEETEDEE